MVTFRPKLLIKSRPGIAGMNFAIGKTKSQIEGLTHNGWHTAKLPEDLNEGEIWDHCHRLLRGGFGVAGAPAVDFVEPDMEQRWHFDSADRIAGKAFRATSSKDSCTQPDGADRRFPAPPETKPNAPYDWRWYQDAAHSGLDAARALIKNPKDRVAIAHLDTGYRKGHALLPEFLDLKLQRSFLDGEDPNDATDRNIGGFGNAPGHGTGTLSILAGGLFAASKFKLQDGIAGGAPFARVIPVRVANSVVAFTNSAIAQGIGYAIEHNVDVLSMSMGGIPSQAWVEMVNAAYEAGITLVTAAGNNFGPFKLRVPRFIVYPARFGRVIAACGAMFDGRPYADFLDATKMAGCYGPDSKMDTAVAAYTPNAPWARLACPDLVDFDGRGTSSATPQVAAAAACWLQLHREAVKQYPEKWMRAEAARRALFSTANNTDREHFGRGTLRAREAMDVLPSDAAALVKQPADSIGVPLLEPTLHVLLGAAKPTLAQRMIRLETAQLVARCGEVQGILVNANLDPDRPAKDMPAAVRNQILEAMLAHPGLSNTLKTSLAEPVQRERVVAAVDGTKPSVAESPQYAPPTTRKLRAFAFDPALGMRLDTESLNETTLEVQWETELKPGPVGEYLEVVDVDPSSNACYAPVDLNHPNILAANGLDPAEGVPQFHQQMVYAVAMKTIQHFETALGRTALWAPQFVKGKAEQDFAAYYVQRLRIYPHALREANAFYSPDKKALLFGYFRASTQNAGDNLPGGLVFNCLSHDVIAHETTHALLDGLHRYYQYQTNPDIAAFHEAFADIVALFQHFTMPEALRHTIARTRGDLRRNNLLADLAQQFGQASGGSRALRSGLSKKPEATDYNSDAEAHELGAVLLAAVFDAFLQIYEARVADLKRLATGGTGILAPGDISTDLVTRMAREASRAAEHVLTTCIRALDYCPPVDLNFGDYLRALITADMDVEPDDQFNYRTAFITAFRARGILPSGVRNVSEENLRWQPPKVEIPPDRIRQMMSMLDLTWNLSTNRRRSFVLGESNGFKLWQWLQQLSDDEARALGRDLGVCLVHDKDTPPEIPLNEAGRPKLHIHSVRPARRTGSRNQPLTDLVVEAVQRYVVKDEESGEERTHRGGCTLLIDMEKEQIRYAIRKRVGKQSRLEAEQKFLRMSAETGQAYFQDKKNREPFAMLHRGF
ncbi:MAG: S8 family serine peptidase [Acidobacteria bacterium]|nr:S8 family serine peptidase [Acidobacteriota bacterium]